MRATRQALAAVFITFMAISGLFWVAYGLSGNESHSLAAQIILGLCLLIAGALAAVTLGEDNR